MSNEKTHMKTLNLEPGAGKSLQDPVGAEIRLSTIRRACAFFKYQWPAQLDSGVMFFEGLRITIEEFIDCARPFRS